MSIQLKIFANGLLEANCFFLINTKTKNCIVIDPGEDASRVLTELAIAELKPVLLLHTHGHYDHAGESALIKKAFPLPFYIHRGDEFLYTNLKKQGEMFSRKLPDPCPIDHFIEEGEVISLDEIPLLKVIHTPGHTEGSCCFLFNLDNKQHLISGDTLFLESVGRTDLPGGDSEKLLHSVTEKLFTLNEETIVYPGHGPKTTIAHEKRYNPIL